MNDSSAVPAFARSCERVSHLMGSRTAMFRMCTSAVAAVALLAGCAGANLGSPAPTPGGSPSAGPTATSGATTVASASPELVPGAKRTPPSGELTPGRYYTPQNAWTPVTFSFDIAEPGW